MFQYFHFVEWMWTFLLVGRKIFISPLLSITYFLNQNYECVFCSCFISAAVSKLPSCFLSSRFHSCFPLPSSFKPFKRTRIPSKLKQMPYPLFGLQTCGLISSLIVHNHPSLFWLRCFFANCTESQYLKKKKGPKWAIIF